MEIVVIDTSVLIKWFVDEIKSDSAIAIRDRYIKGELSLLAPNLILYELLNALKYINLHNQNEVERIFETITNYGIEFCSLDTELANKTIEIAMTNKLTIYDSTYVALANLKKGKIITADEKMLKNAPKEYKKYVKLL